MVPAQPCLIPSKALMIPAVSCLIPSWLPGVTTDCWVCGGVHFSFCCPLQRLRGWACMCVCGGGLGTGGIILLLAPFYRYFMYLCSLAWGLYRRGALLCLVPSLIQHSWDASCQLVVLCVMVQGGLGCWGRGLSSLLIVWDPGGLPSVTLSWRLSLL